MGVVDNRIFVNGVPSTATKEELEAHFGQFGATTDVYMPANRETGQHKGICFVTYESSEGSQLALSQPGHTIHGVQVTVDNCLSKDKGDKGSGKSAKSAMPGLVNTGDRLFVSKIPPDTTRQEVEELFAQFGEWTDFFLPSGKFTGGHKGICFISYADPQSAQYAIESGPHQLHGEDLVIELAQARDASGKGKGKDKGKDNGKGKAPVWPQAASTAPAWGPPAAAKGGFVAKPPIPGAWAPQTPGKGAQKGAAPAHPVTVGLKTGRLFLTKVPEDVTKEDLTLYFQQYGELQDVYRPSFKAIAFVSFVDPSLAQMVTQHHEHEVKVGRLVTVDLAYDRPPIEAKGKGKFRFEPYGK